MLCRSLVGLTRRQIKLLSDAREDITLGNAAGVPFIDGGPERGRFRTELAEDFLAIDRVATVDIVEAFRNQTIDFLRRVLLAEIP